MPKNGDRARSNAPNVLELRSERPASRKPGYSRSDLLGFFETMVTARALDDEEIKLRKRNEAYFQVSGAGHEAIGVAAGFCLKPGHDWFLGHYRDRALLLQLGMTPYEMLLSAVGAKDDPNSEARQMPCHWCLPRANVLSRSSSVGTQFHHACGCAMAGRYIRKHGLKHRVASDEIVLCTTGEGTTCQGEFFEAVNVACLRQLPVVFLIEDNGYAISVPVEESIAGGSVSGLVSGFPNLSIHTVDGNDLLASLDVMRKAVEAIRGGDAGPVLVHAQVTRPYSHSLSDDHSAYRLRTELEAEKANDCIYRFEQYLLGEGVATREDLKGIRAKIKGRLSEAVDRALKAPKPDPATVMTHLVSGRFPVKDETPSLPQGEPMTMAQAINLTLAREMERDESILVFGEDVADASRKAVLTECKGKGGVFKITYGLQKKFGEGRVFNTPLAEAGIVGRAIGMAMRGLRPVPEIQFFDFIWPAMTQIRNELAILRYRSAGQNSAPVVLRIPIGGYLRGGAIYHSQTGESIFAKCPGLYIAYPSNAADACGLLRAAIRGEDPVLFFEHKNLYYQAYARSQDPGPDYMVPLGKAAIRRRGQDMTLVTWGGVVYRSLEAAEAIAKQDGLNVEVIDLRSIVPLDTETVFESVRRTGRCLVVHEEGKFAGIGGEVAARVGQECFEWLDAPVHRVGSLDTWIPYSPVLEEAVLPNADSILQELRTLASY
jgi:2-oxoisovalerate dehydrogenase E1 component